MDLRASFKHIDPLLGGHALIAVEVGGALFELGKILDRLEGSLRAKQSLDIHAAQRRRFNAVSEFLRPNVAHEMVGSVGVTIGVTIETGYTQGGPVGSTVLRGVELNWVTNRRTPSSCLGFSNPLKIS